ncbi:MAG: molybdate ABC transporter substrate-binding protein [Chitinivibrionales bacterium]|nr:molybdate ABC transporter substrate-binding protein [Chitinivibrionales bacterium]MBD3356456.1 molybdate ABC transporter substrate-binding protein [Chitinivibrionales bacterium]
MFRFLRYSFLSVVILVVGVADGAPAYCAVAANFTAVLKDMVPLFEKITGQHLRISYGSTGRLYSQIVNGAPFHVFLAADSIRPYKLESAGYGVPGTRYTYARGVLVVWSLKKDMVDTMGGILGADTWRFCATANPLTAPYGTAARQVLENLGLWDRIRPRLVQGNSIAQTWQQVASANADIGFVAYSQIVPLPPEKKGSYWVVPDSLYEPLHQQALLLKGAEANEAARAFLEYLRSPSARKIIIRYGYNLGVIDDAR